MDFIEAMRCIKEGETIRRSTWEDTSVVCTLREGTLQIYVGGKWSSWLICEADMYARDWEAVAN